MSYVSPTIKKINMETPKTPIVPKADFNRSKSYKLNGLGAQSVHVEHQYRNKDLSICQSKVDKYVQAKKIVVQMHAITEQMADLEEGADDDKLAKDLVTHSRIYAKMELGSRASPEALEQRAREVADAALKQAFGM